MRKIFFVWMMVAAIATLLTGCNNDEPEPTPTPPPPAYSNQFTIGDDTFDITFACKVENVSIAQGYSPSIVAFASDSLMSEHNNVYCLIYDGEITNGPVNIAFDFSQLTLPKVIALRNVTVSEVLNDFTNITEDGIAIGTAGTFTLNEDNGIYTVTTENMALVLNELAVNGSISYQGELETIEIPNINEGNVFTINDEEHEIAAAVIKDFEYNGFSMRVMAYVSTTMTDVIAVEIGEEIVPGSFSVPSKMVLMVRNFDMTTNTGDISIATSGDVSIANADMGIYEVSISNASFFSLSGSSTATLNYKGYIVESPF